MCRDSDQLIYDSNMSQRRDLTPEESKNEGDWITPRSKSFRVVGANFSGFAQDDKELPAVLIQRRMLELERRLSEMAGKQEKMEERQLILENENKALKSRCE